MIANVIRRCFPLAAAALAHKAEEINKFNVFPVPDGDTGTNMSLTLKTVVGELEALPAEAGMDEVAQAIIHGSLMGARGNSGVITSQILRGLASGFAEIPEDKSFDTADLARAWKKSVKVAFQAVRKPVEGTILTVLKDVARRAAALAAEKQPLPLALEALVIEAYQSVARTPELLPVLKENGVVDSGAFGFATFIEAFVAAYLGKTFSQDTTLTGLVVPGSNQGSELEKPKISDIQVNDDWEGSEYRYCTELLFHAEKSSFVANAEPCEEKTRDFLASLGDCELLVGACPDYKVHVHTNEPNRVVEHLLELGQISEVFIHNMDLEAQDRTAKIARDKADDNTKSSGANRAAAAESGSSAEGAAGAASQGGTGVAAQGVQGAQGAAAASQAPKELGFVAVAAGSGQAEILKTLGVDVIVSGGQTMNPSCADIVDAIEKVNAKSVIVLPNNSNIRMTAEASVDACRSKSVYVVPTKTVLQAFCALFALDLSLDPEENVELMTESLEQIRDGEITRAVRDSAAADGSPIHTNDIIGISSGSIEVVGSSVQDVTLKLIAKMQEQEAGDTLTLLAGSELSEEDFSQLTEAIKSSQPDLEVDAHRGEQPLYPVVFSIE